MNTFHDKITSVRNSWMILSLGSSFQERSDFSKIFHRARDSYWRDERSPSSPNAREFHLFFESNPWFSTIASFGLSRSLWIDLEKYMVLLLPFFPLPFSFSLLLIVLGLKSLEVDFMSFLSSVNEIVDICAESSRDFEKNLIQSIFAIICLNLKKLINIF